MTRIILAGPGRAGTAVALAMLEAGHTVTGVLARRPDAATAAAALLGTVSLPWDAPLPEADLMMVAVRDDAIEEAAARIAPYAGAVKSAMHLSGLATVSALGPLESVGLTVGSFHPLQTLPTPEAGAARIPGAWIAVTTDDPATRGRLHGLALSLGALPFDLDDGAKPIYHAAASAAANFTLAALTMAEGLFSAAGVPLAAAEPLVTAIVANAFELGPSSALTGPVARGDVGTVAAQLAAVRVEAPDWAPAFVAFASELARLTGKSEAFSDVLG